MLVNRLLEVAQKILGINDLFAKSARDRKDRTATLFLQISTSLFDAVEALERSESPVAIMREILHYASGLPDAISDTIGLEQAEKIANEMRWLHHIDWACMIMDVEDQFEREASREKLLVSLRQAAGGYKAISNLLRASK